MTGNAYLGNFPLISICTEKDCDGGATRILIMVEPGETPTESEITVICSCDLHAQVYEAMLDDHSPA